MREARHEEGVALLRNALVAAQLNELDAPGYELDALDSLIDALFKTDALDGLEELVPRYREVAKASSERQGGFSYEELRSLLYSARLHEVLCVCTPRRSPFTLLDPCFQQGRIASDCRRFHHARDRTHALVEPSALYRHAGGLKRQWGRCAFCSS
jgi:hypothetical protein